jgi:hypothetical protein
MANQDPSFKWNYWKQKIDEEIEKLQSLLSSIKTYSNSTKDALVVEAQSQLLQAQDTMLFSNGNPPSL